MVSPVKFSQNVQLWNPIQWWVGRIFFPSRLNTTSGRGSNGCLLPFIDEQGAVGNQRLLTALIKSHMYSLMYAWGENSEKKRQSCYDQRNAQSEIIVNIDGEQSPGAEWATPKGADRLKCGLERTLPPVHRETGRSPQWPAIQQIPSSIMDVSGLGVSTSCSFWLEMYSQERELSILHSLHWWLL